MPFIAVEKAEFIGSLPAGSMAENSYFTIRLEKQLPSLRGNASETVLERDWIAFTVRKRLASHFPYSEWDPYVEWLTFSPSSRLQLPRLDFALSEIPSLIAELIHEMQLTIESKKTWQKKGLTLRLRLGMNALKHLVRHRQLQLKLPRKKTPTAWTL